jgi:glycosyltransferase involved in cell wall biosynthesis
VRIDATGFVGVQSGSVASANAVLLRGLLGRQNQVRFFTKPSFVEPREIDLSPSEAANLEVVDCTNHPTDLLRKWTSFIPALNRVTGWADVSRYNRRIVKQMNFRNHRLPKADVHLWLGDFVRGEVGGIPSIGYLQGPPGTDARSILRHRELITVLAGRTTYMKLRLFAIWRMGLGHPNLSASDHLIVGSQWSKSDLIDHGIKAEHIHVLPYPIDLKQFIPSDYPRSKTGRLRLLWLGRFVPRKRLDLFLDGLALAIQDGCDVEALIIGSSGFVPGYERLIQEFPYQDRIKHLPLIARNQVPNVLSDIDVMAQPSDDENFGSSVAEALACGVPCIVGRTNGTGDYVCNRSIILADDKPESMAGAIEAMGHMKKQGDLQDRSPSRRVAEHYFDSGVVLDKLMRILEDVTDKSTSNLPAINRDKAR